MHHQEGKVREGEKEGLDRGEVRGARYLSSAQGRFTSPDKPFADQTPFDPQSWNLFSYTRNNPLKYVDRTGEAIETAWDIFNIGLGGASFVDNVRAGSYGSAAVDAVGVVIDSAATVVPFVPGGVGAGIKAVRVADRVADAADLVTTSNRIDNAVDACRTTANLVTGAAQGKVAKGAANPKVKEALARGQEAHKQADYRPGFKKEVTLPSGKRMDAYNKTDKRIEWSLSRRIREPSIVARSKLSNTARNVTRYMARATRVKCRPTNEGNGNGVSQDGMVGRFFAGDP